MNLKTKEKYFKIISKNGHLILKLEKKVFLSIRKHWKM